MGKGLPDSISDSHRNCSDKFLGINERRVYFEVRILLFGFKKLVVSRSDFLPQRKDLKDRDMEKSHGEGLGGLDKGEVLTLSCLDPFLE